MTRLPKARTGGILSESVGEDLVVYDEILHTAHSLSAAAASVWTLCDGETSASELAASLQLEPATVDRAIQELADCRLLEGDTIDPSLLSRRQAAKRLAKVGGAALVAPMIYSIAIGPATAAASVACTPNANGTPMPYTATCSNPYGFGTSTGPGACCNGQCYASSGPYYCPAPNCVQADSYASEASDCCSGDFLPTPMYPPNYCSNS